MRDLDYLRRLVGDQKLTFLGESTGTVIGQTYANVFPLRVRAMALDGLEDPVGYTSGTAAVLSQSLTDVDRVFERFIALCQAAGPARCALAGRGPVRSRAPCASWPTRSADRYTGPWNASTRRPSCSSVRDSIRTRRWRTRSAPGGDWTTRCS